MLAFINLGRDQARDRPLSRSDIGKSNSLKTSKTQGVLMTKTELKKEYADVMLQADQASGRRETMDLYKEARSIKKKLSGDEHEYPLIHNG